MRNIKKNNIFFPKRNIRMKKKEGNKNVTLNYNAQYQKEGKM